MNSLKFLNHVVILLLSFGFAAGCASTGTDKAVDTANSLTQSADYIAKGNAQIDKTLSTLNDLVNNPNKDLRKQYNAFDSAVNDLNSTAKNVGDRAADMKSQGTAYFKQWDKESAQLKNEDIRNRSEARKNEVASRFSRITQQYDNTKATFQPFIADLRDVQKYLSTDLTSAGLSNIKGVVAKANADAEPLKAALASLGEEFKMLGLSMSPKK